MQRFSFRFALCGFAVAIVLFGVVLHSGHTPRIDHLVIVLWPTSILIAARPGSSTPFGSAGFLKMIFSAVMNGSLYFGVAWIVWWAARFLKVLKAEPTQKERFVSGFIVMGLALVVLVGLVELFLKGLPEASARAFTGVWLVTSNLFSLMVITCALSGWSMWWLRNYYRRRQAAQPPDAPHSRRRARKKS